MVSAWYRLSLGLSLAPFITSRGLLELQQSPSRAEASRRLVRNAEGQAGRGVEARVAKVETRGAAATKAWNSEKK